MKDRAEALLNALGNEHGHLATVTGSGDGREVHLVFTALDGRTMGLAAIAQIQQTCIEHGYLPYAQEVDTDDRVLTIDCHAGSVVRGIVDRVALDHDGLLVKLEGDAIHCVALPPVGDLARRRLLMMRSGDVVIIRLVENAASELMVGDLRNQTLGDA
jgi:hypothetical protein